VVSRQSATVGAAIGVLAVKVRPLRGRFAALANLDSSARRWLLATVTFC
jgi:hypothetical protein